MYVVALDTNTVEGRESGPVPRVVVSPEKLCEEELRFDTGLREVLETFAYAELAPEEELPVGPGSKSDEFVVDKGTTTVEVNVEDWNVVRIEKERLPVSRTLAEPCGTVDVVLAGYGGEDKGTDAVDDGLALLSLIRLLLFSDREVVPRLLATPDVSEYKVVDKVMPVDALLEFEKIESVRVPVAEGAGIVNDELTKEEPVGDSVVNALPFVKGC